MSPTVVVVSRLQLIRQGIAGRLALLGATVREYADSTSALKILTEVVPDIMILDVDDAVWSWRPLVESLSLAQHTVHVVLLARRMGIDEAAVAKRLGVAGVILKPFREEEHMGRLFGLMNEGRRAAPRRSQPRYYPEPESHSLLTLPGPLSALYRIVNISLGGVCVARPESGLRELEELPGDVAVRLSTGGVHLGVTCRVSHRSDEAIGLQFRAMSSGRLDFIEHMGSLQNRVFGPRRVRGPW
jgi:CheY-like chemotaxis protein